MPVITVKLVEGELTWGQTAEMVDNITRAVSLFTRDVAQSNVWVLVEQVKNGPEGIGARAFGHAGLTQVQRRPPTNRRPLRWPA